MSTSRNKNIYIYIYIQTYRHMLYIHNIYSSIPSYISPWWVNLDPPSSKHPHVLPWPGPKDGARRPASGASGASAARQPNLAQWEQIWAAARKRSGEGAVLNEGGTVKFEKNGDEKMIKHVGFSRSLGFHPENWIRMILDVTNRELRFDHHVQPINMSFGFQRVSPAKHVLIWSVFGTCRHKRGSNLFLAGFYVHK